MTRCRSCLIPDSRPDTEFIDGECSACISYRRRGSIDWDARHKALLQLLDQHHGECIVASSGGKDSTYIAITLKEMGADVTAVTATTCQAARTLGPTNIRNLARLVPTIEVSPNMTVRAKLNRLGLQLVGDISWPEHVSIFTTPFRVAEALGKHLIFYGENPQEAYGGPEGSDAAFELDSRWRSEFGGFLGLRPSDLIGKDGITERDMHAYTLPPAGKSKAYFLGQFMRWDSHLNAKFAQRHGFIYFKPSRASWWGFENQDNLQTGVHDYLMFLKYGYGRGCAQISVDIRAGLVFRDFALRWVEQNDGAFPDPYYLETPLSEVLDHIGMTRAEFDAICERFSS